MNNSKIIGNSINHRDYRLDHDYINENEDDTIRLVDLFLSFYIRGYQDRSTCVNRIIFCVFL